MSEPQRFFLYWAATFNGLYAFWELAEAGTPGRQYADLLWPTVLGSALLALLVYAADLTIRRPWRRR